MGKNKKSNNSKIIFGIVLLVLIVLCAGFIKRPHDSTIKEKDLYSDIKESLILELLECNFLSNLLVVFAKESTVEDKKSSKFIINHLLAIYII